MSEEKESPKKPKGKDTPAPPSLKDTGKELTTKYGKTDPMVLAKVFPNLDPLLMEFPKLAEIQADCVYVLDANVLLAPFKAGKSIQKDLEKVYRTLLKKGRLYVPAQALREFVKNRPTYISDAFAHVEQRLSQLPKPGPVELPAFEDTKEFKELADLAEKLTQATAAYRKKALELQTRIRTWSADDWLSKLYHEMIDDEHIIEPELSEAEVIADAEWRKANLIPPGYKDQRIGDIIIWNSMIPLAKIMQKNVIFVTHDEKVDWMQSHGETALFPRFELREEFWRKTGNHFYIMRLDAFLELMGAKVETVREIGYTAELAKLAASAGHLSYMLKDPPNMTIREAFSAMEDILNEFLDPWEPDEFQEYPHIHGRFEGVADRIINHTERDVSELSRYGTFGEVVLDDLSKKLDRMTDLNGHIGYESHRMKRSTTEEEKELSALAQTVLRTLEQLRSLKIF